MKKFFKWTTVLLVAAVFLSTFVFLYQKSKPKVVEYEVYEVTTKNLEKKTIVTGKIEPRDEVNIKPQISGIITELFKEAGQMVRKDEVIAKVKVIPDMGNLSSAENRVRVSKMSLDQVQREHDRVKILFVEKVLSAEEFEKSALSLQQAQAEYEAAQDALNIVREGISLSNANMSTTLIRSTIDGLILDIPVKVGNSVILSNSFNDGTTIATVADMTKLIFRGNIDETEVGRVVEGMPVVITVGAIQDLYLNASLEYISPKGVEVNGANQFEIKASVSINDSILMRSGYSANAEIVLAEARNVLVIPESAIEFSGDSTFVYVVQGEDDEKTYQRTYVETGLSDGVKIEIKNGIGENDKIRGPQIVE